MQNAEVLLELGGVIIGLALLARVAGAIGIPAIPLYLIAGLAFGAEGPLPLVTTSEFIEIGAEIGLILLLFMLGLEYTAAELTSTLKSSMRAGVLDLVLNFAPGFAAGLILGWSAIPAAFLGGITYASSSGVVAKSLYDLGRMANRETPVILSLVVIEDLAMALYLPVMAGLLLGGTAAKVILTVGIAVAAVTLILGVALRIELGVSRIIFSQSDETLLLTILGMTLLVAGLAEALQASAAVGALLVGIVLSGPAAHSARSLLAPLRDLFAAMFFMFFGLSVDPSGVSSVAGAALLLGAITAGTKFVAGWWSAADAGVGRLGRARTGATLIARGEFSIAIGGLGVAAGIEPELGPLTVGYVLFLAILGPIAARFVEPVVIKLSRQKPRR